MISLLLLLLFLSLATIPFRGKSFEISTACLLFIPIELSLFGQFIPVGFFLCFGLLILNLSLCYLLSNEDKSEGTTWSFKNVWSLSTLKEQQANILWIVSYCIIFQLCLLWPDFVAMGERIRDFALLSEVVKYPINPTEPWLPGENLNYYLFWYRLGAVLHQLTGLEVYELYHGLQALTFGLYIAVLSRVLQLIGGLRSYLAIGYSVLIAFGSNIAGLLYAVDQTGQSWWGPSRVIKGAINEFPVWSFLLGDLHPHYLNLPLLLVFITWIYQLFIARKKSSFAFLFLMLLIASPLWVYNANAWEVPVLLLLIGFSALLFLVLSSENNLKNISSFYKDLLATKVSEITASILVLLLGCVITLYLLSKHISPGGDPFRRVSELIPLTTIKELFSHFGFQLIPIIFALCALQKNWQQSLIVVLGFGFCLLSSTALPLIILLLVIHAQFLLSQDNRKEISTILFGALSLTSLALLLLPELFFLDDPYGGENERMNTIFKAYSANWGFLSIFAIVICRDAFKKLITDTDLSKVLAPIAFLSLAFCTLPFFFHTVNERRIDSTTVLPRIQGLSSLDKQFEGAGEVIKTFFIKPDGITAEAPGNPYSLTSHMCTLSGKRCYIGWKNHVDLLTRKYDESKRREEVLTQMYTSKNCELSKEIMNKEKIRYLVIGPLEQERFGAVDVNNFNCLTLVATKGKYTVLTSSIE
jgi:uncharacterized membrane protein